MIMRSGGSSRATDHEAGDVNVDGGGHFVVGAGAEGGADDFFGGVGFGGVGVVETAVVRSISLRKRRPLRALR
jgi:hypothetical protein